MKKSKDLKASILLIISVLVVVMLFSVMTSCSQKTCPTYAGMSKYKKSPNYTVKHKFKK